jgi:uncharacterized membrane protein
MTHKLDPRVMSGAELQRRATAAGLLALTLAMLLVMLTGATGNWRLVLTTAFVVLAPGWAITAYLRAAPASFRWSVGIALGIAIGMLLGQIMVLLNAWHPLGAVAVLGVLTLVPLAHHLLRAPSKAEAADKAAASNKAASSKAASNSAEAAA